MSSWAVYVCPQSLLTPMAHSFEFTYYLGMTHCLFTIEGEESSVQKSNNTITFVLFVLRSCCVNIQFLRPEISQEKCV